MVILGIEALVRDDFAVLQGKRVGLMSNPSAVTHQLQSTYDIFASSEKVQLTALFAPEHGFSASVQDGEKVATGHDARTGAPVYSLYGASLRPTQDMLTEIDVMVCDIQDIGVRYYTFLWTISHIIEVCGESSIPVIILDRPNPLGDAIAGCGLAADISTLVGRYDIPIQHGMTLGELILYLNQVHNPTPCDVSVIACEDYHRAMTWEQTGLHFVPPSPNMPHLITAQHYTGACLIEGTSLSEGRGTTLPFEIVGAPTIDGDALANSLNALNLDGVGFRPHAFTPIMSKYAGEQCFGFQAHITDLKTYQPIQTWLTILAIIQRDFADALDWKASHFDRLIGNHTIRGALQSGMSVDDMTAGWDDYCADFAQKRAPYLLY